MSRTDGAARSPRAFTVLCLAGVLLGALYHLWSEGQEVRLARSVDRGASWTTWTVFEGDEVQFFPYLVARGEGELAATWFPGSGYGMTARVARIDVPAGDGGEPRIRLTEPFQTESWDERSGSRRRDPAGEYLPVAFLSTGALGVATPIQNFRDDRLGFAWWRVVSR